MNKLLHTSIRVLTFMVVAAPFFAWWVVAIEHPYQVPGPCAHGDYECQVDSIDAHQIP